MNPLAQSRRVLVRATNWIGDAVMTLPALRELRRALPDAHLSILARPWVGEIFERDAVADRVIEYRQNWRRTAASLRDQKFDAAVLLQNAFEAALIARWADIPVRCGYARDGRSLLLTHAAAVPSDGQVPRHECYYYLELLRRLGVIAELPHVRHIVFSSAAAHNAPRQQLAAFGIPLSHHGPVIGISPGAAFGTAKRWFPSRFAAAARALAADGARIVIFGSGSERPLAEAMAVEIGPAAVSLAGRTSLGEFIDLVAGCDLFITNDSGAMHLAAAAAVPVLAIFGATDETGTAPLGPRVRILKRPPPCSPCKLRDCPIDHRCMRAIEVTDVVEAAREMLAQPASVSITTISE